MSLQRMESDTAETVAGVVRLLRRAAQLVWDVVDAECAESPRQVLALSIDLAADEARNILPDEIRVDRPVPVGDEPVDYIRSADQLLRRAASAGARIELHALQARVADLVWGGEHRCRRLTGPRSASFLPTATPWPARRSSTQP